MSAISFMDVVNKFSSAYSIPSRSEKRKLPENYVFDEDKSVRWNKEQVFNHNLAKHEEDTKFRELHTKAVGEANGFAGEYLAQEYGISKEVGVKVFLFAKQEKDSLSSIEAILDYAEDICELFKEEN
jgi:hypothetical protein